MYVINNVWNKFLIDVEDTSRIRSTRSHKSKFAYAEGELVGDKPALYIYPFYLEPLYVLDKNDITEDNFAVLCDRLKWTSY